MSIYLRPESRCYVVEVRWQGCPQLKLSTGTTNKQRARAMEWTLRRLRDVGRRDVLGLLADGRLSLADVHDDYVRDPAALEQRLTSLASPVLGPLIDEWLAWLESPATISPRTHRTYALRTVRRYRESWEALLRLLPKGREAILTDITRGFLADYRTKRRREERAGATLNRDVAALQSFLRWAEEERGLAVPQFRMPKEREPEGRERWLDADEIATFEQATPREWWPLFALLVYTGLRIGEAQGLRWADVRLAERRIRVHERSGRRLKTSSSQRDLPIPEPLAVVLGTHAACVPSGSTDLVFPPPLSDYWRACHCFQRVVRSAGIADVTLHDLRHTFGVHCAQSGVPLPRLQKLMGHASPVMTMRYMKHAPEAYFAEDAARLAASLSGEREQGARAELARLSLKQA